MIRGSIIAVCFAAPACADVSCDWLIGMPLVDVVIVGEVHDNPLHHEVQTCVLESVRPAASVFEMLTPEMAVTANLGLWLDTDEFVDALGWDDAGWPDFAMYNGLFRAHWAANDVLAEPAPPMPDFLVPDETLPQLTVFYGAGVPREQFMETLSDGAAVAFGAEAARYGLTEPLPPDQQVAREALQFAAHCDALPDAMLSRFVEAQRFRDARLAQAIVQAHEDTGGRVIVITGNGHARTDWGVPAVLAQAAPGLSVFSVGQIEGEAAADEPFDLVLTSSELERPDPCEAFR